MEIQRRDTARRYIYGSFAALALAVVGLWNVNAHIVPPEKLHPVTESYRRMEFMLQLNPVVWTDVARDATVIANGVEVVDPAVGGDYRREALGLVEAAAERGGLPLVERRQTAARVHGLSANAVAAKLKAHLENAAASLDDHSRATAELSEARALWSAFEPALQASNRGAYAELGRTWLELSSALGSPGVLGMGAVAADVQTFEDGKARLIAALTLPDEPVAKAEDNGTGVLAGLLLPETAYSPQAMLAALPPGSDINKQLPRPRQILNMATRGVDEAETPMIALGDMAFDSPEIFGEPARSLGISCNTCHNKGTTNPKLFIPGISARPGGLDVTNSFFAPHARNGIFDHLDTPDLRGIRFTAPYGRNGRFDSLRDFTRNVIVNEFNGEEPDPMLLDSLVIYMLEFDFLPNPHLKPDGWLTADAPAEALRGEEIFRRDFPQMNGSCASCHDPADHFVDRRRHDVGTVQGAEPHSRDRALDTPTLLSVAHTPPYLHDGSAATLEDAVAHFNDHYTLELSEAELADLTAYVRTVGSGTEAFEDSVFTLEAELEEFSFFLSTYELLRARGKDDLVDATLKTVAFEIEAHKWDVQDRRHMPTLDRLQDLVTEAWEARQRGEFEVADAHVAEYRALYEENREVLR